MPRPPRWLFAITLIVGAVWLSGEVAGQVPAIDGNKFAGLKWTFARIKYGSFDNEGAAPSRLAYWDEPWAIDAPAAEQNLSRRIKSVTAIDVGEPIVLSLEDPKLWENPWIYIVEPSNLQLKDTEVPILREFLLRGGTLTFDDFHGPYEWELTEKQLKRVFPDREIVEIAPPHPIYTLLLSHRQVSADSRSRLVPERPHLGEGRLHGAPARHPRRQGPADGADQLEHRHGRRRRVVQRAGISGLLEVDRAVLPDADQRSDLFPDSLSTRSHMHTTGAAVEGLAEKVANSRLKILAELRKVIVGQDEVVDEVLMAMFCGGHCLITGVPGLAKTLLVKTIAQILDLSFKRIQFTPDLMPADITGTEILDEDHGSRSLRFVQGPIFAQIILADEINRTPPKTQAALLEAMQEYHVTAAGRTYQLERPFFVLATQNPIELEGTYPLPEAQLDRFLFNVVMTYLSEDDEVQVVTDTTSTRRPEPARVLSGADILQIQDYVRQVLVAEEVVRYAVRLADSSRPGRGAKLDFIEKWVKWGAGLRASHALVIGAKARALLHGRHHVSVKDIQALAKPIFRHRVLPNFYAEAEGITSDRIVEQLLDAVPVPVSGL